jgi:hypothetical protein
MSIACAIRIAKKGFSEADPRLVIVLGERLIADVLIDRVLGE